MRLSLLVMTVAPLVIGCTEPSEEPLTPSDTGFPLAFFHDDCAPWDGPALTLTLTHSELTQPFQAEPPFIGLSLYLRTALAEGAVFQWEGTDHNQGYVQWCTGGDACEVATSVRVRITEAAHDRLRGDVRLEFGEGSVIGGPFSAERLDHRALCG